MLGRFLELSVQTGDIRASVEFYESLGFRQCLAGETWSHPYAVMSDGRLFVGLHEYAFDSPALTFVRPDLSAHLPELERRGVLFEFRKTGEDTFNEAGFLDPDGHMIALLEARTYSPPAFDDRDFSLIGRFRAYALPVRDLEPTLDFWHRLGAETAQSESQPYPCADMGAGGARFELHQTRDFRQASLLFADDDAALSDRLRHKGMELPEDATGASLVTPEGLRIRIVAPAGA
ncbi:MAG: hypothetical protein ACREVN_05355 [Gammaproteobacteria bacterium]